MSLALASRRAAISPAWVKSPLWRTARAVPSLDLPFADTKSLADAVTGQSLVTFTRASSGTSVGSDGVLWTAAVNEPRFDHNPTTGESLGLLVEEQRTNLVRNNTMVGAVAGSPGTPPTNGWVIVNNATYASSIIGTGIENGINYIDVQYVIAAGAAASGGLVYADTPVATASTAYTGSYYLKLASGTSPQIRFVWQDGVNTFNRTFFDPTGTLTRYADTVTTSVGANLARFAISFAASPSGATFVIRIGLPQVELGAFATSVIPTTTAAATRSADVASITGTAFSSWYRADEGTVFAEGATVLPSTGITHRPLCYFGNSAATDRWEQRYMSIGVGSRVYVNDDGATQADFSFSTPSAGQVIRIASAIALNNFAASVNGSSVQTDASGTVPTNDRLEIATSVNQANCLNGTIRRLCYWPQRLPNSTIQALTQ